MPAVLEPEQVRVCLHCYHSQKDSNLYRCCQCSKQDLESAVLNAYALLDRPKSDLGKYILTI